LKRGIIHKMKYFSKKQIYEGQALPSWYGIARRQIFLDSLECYPIPFNWIVRAYDAIRYIMKIPGHSQYEQDMQKAYHRGYDAGKHQAILDQCFTDLQDRIDLIKKDEWDRIISKRVS
jgi:hypothetical protein